MSKSSKSVLKNKSHRLPFRSRFIVIPVAGARVFGTAAVAVYGVLYKL